MMIMVVRHGIKGKTGQNTNEISVTFIEYYKTRSTEYRSREVFHTYVKLNGNPTESAKN
jgi:hypothetical protein